MNTWQKILVIFVGMGLSAVLTFCTTQWTDWSVVFGSFQAAIVFIVGKSTGFQPKVS